MASKSPEPKATFNSDPGAFDKVDGKNQSAAGHRENAVAGSRFWTCHLDGFKANKQDIFFFFNEHPHLPKIRDKEIEDIIVAGGADRNDYVPAAMLLRSKEAALRVLQFHGALFDEREIKVLIYVPGGARFDPRNEQTPAEPQRREQGRQLLKQEPLKRHNEGFGLPDRSPTGAVPLQALRHRPPRDYTRARLAEYGQLQEPPGSRGAAGPGAPPQEANESKDVLIQRYLRLQAANRALMDQNQEVGGQWKAAQQTARDAHKQLTEENQKLECIRIDLCLGLERIEAKKKAASRENERLNEQNSKLAAQQKLLQSSLASLQRNEKVTTLVENAQELSDILVRNSRAEPETYLGRQWKRVKQDALRRQNLFQPVARERVVVAINLAIYRHRIAILRGLNARLKEEAAGWKCKYERVVQSRDYMANEGLYRQIQIERENRRKLAQERDKWKNKYELCEWSLAISKEKLHTATEEIALLRKKNQGFHDWNNDLIQRYQALFNAKPGGETELGLALVAKIKEQLMKQPAENKGTANSCNEPSQRESRQTKNDELPTQSERDPSSSSLKRPLDAHKAAPPLDVPRRESKKKESEAKLTAENSALLSKNALLQATLKELMTEMAKMKQRHASLSDEVKDCKDTERQKQTIEKELGILQKRHDSVCAEKSKLSNKMNGLQKGIDAIKQKLKAASDREKAQKDQYQALEERLKSAKDRKKALKQQLREATERTDSLTAEWKRTNGSLVLMQQQRDELKAKLDNTKDVESLEAENSRLKVDLKQARVDQAELKETADRYDALAEDTKGLTSNCRLTALTNEELQGVHKRAMATASKVDDERAHRIPHCVICCHTPPQAMFQPCRHLVVCRACHDELKQKPGPTLCPTCRKKIRNTIYPFM